MKILFLGNQDIFGSIQNGGSQCAKRNYDLIKNVIGEKNLYVGIVWNSESDNDRIQYFKRAETNTESLISCLHLCRLYKYNEEKKILSFIESVNPDILFLDTPLFGKLLKKLNPRIRVIMFMQNVEAKYARHRLKNVGLKVLPAYWATVYNEKIAVKYADQVISLNERDAKILQKIYHRKPDYLLPISFKDVFDCKKVHRKKEKKLIFIGSNFPPNYDGVLWFINHVMPELADFQLIIVGKGFEDASEEFTRENVTVVGTAESLELYYYEYSMVVMPIRYGDGMKVKTAEAMMYGMAIFATDEALEGYESDGVSGIYRCNTEKDFIKNIRDYYNKRNLESYEKGTRLLFEKYYNIDVQKELMKKILSI